MSEEKDKEQLKKEAAKRAKELALKKLAERKALAEGNDQAVKSEGNLEKSDSTHLGNNEEQQSTEKTELTEKTEKVENNQEPQVDDVALAKQKAAAAAKAKAAAAAKAKAAALAKQQAPTEATTETNGADAKAKAAAAAKAKAAAAAKAKAAAQASGAGADDDVKAKAIAAAKAKAAAAAAAKAASAGGAGKAEEVVVEEKPRANQVFLDKYVKVIAEHLGEDVLEAAYLNPISKDVPTLVAKLDTYFKVAEFLKYNEQLGFDYLSEIHGSDFETHMEVYVHLYSYKNRQSVALKVKIDRDQPVIDSIQPLWEGANWPEREAYDLLGITFKNHPKLERILLPDDWVGHPLRKDYEPYDVEV